MHKFLEIIRNTQPRNKITTIVFIVILTATFALSVYARYNQLSIWEQNSERYFAEGSPMMTTLDAYKFLRHAQEIDSGVYNPDVDDEMIFYPDGARFPDPVPLLSVVLNGLVQTFGGSYYMTALYMIPFMSSLFIIPLGIYFFMLGLPAAGILGGLITTFAPMFYGRTSIGRFDTDGMNLFFLFTASLFILLASRAKKQHITYIYAGLSGLTVMLFYWWYHHGMFNLFFPVALAVSLYFAKAKWKDIAIATAILVILSNPLFTYKGISQLIHAINIYLFPIKDAVAYFPNVYNTISEAQSASPLEVMQYVSGSPAIVVIGLAGAGLLAIAHIKNLVPLVAIVGLGLMAFISANRFTVFLAPIVGVGIGYLITLALHTNKNEKTEMLRNALTYGVVILLFASLTITGKNAFSFVPGPSIQPQTFRAFQAMKEVLPKNSAILTWWDYGLAITEASGLKVFHSGMTQETPKTWMIAKALTSDEQTLYNITSYIDTFGVSELDNLDDSFSLTEFEQRIENYSGGPTNDATYVLVTLDMPSKLYPISYLANWDMSSNESTPYGVEQLRCTIVDKYNIDCGKYKINTASGLLNNQAPIKRYINTNMGKIITDTDFGYSDGLYIIQDNIGLSYLMGKEAFNSALMQLYALDKYSPELFTPALDMYPFARLYKVNKK